MVGELIYLSILSDLFKVVPSTTLVCTYVHFPLCDLQFVGLSKRVCEVCELGSLK